MCNFVRKEISFSPFLLFTQLRTYKTKIDLSFPATVVGKEYNFVIKEIVPEDKLSGMTYDPTVYALQLKL